MRKIMLVLVVMAGLAGRQSLLAQDIKSPAELIPANALVYGELRQVGPLAMEIRRLIETSALGNLPDSLLKIRARYEKTMPPWRNSDLAAVGMVFSSEVAKELQRVQGVAAALTGISPQGEPEFVVVILPGQSFVPHFLTRMLLAVERFRQVETIEGVQLHRSYYQSFRKQANDLPPQIIEIGPVVAHMPGLIVIGSREAVKDVILRAKGKARNPGLAEDKSFREASQQIGDKPGVFVFANPNNLVQMVKDKAPLGAVEAMALSWVQILRHVAYGVSLEQGTLHYRALGLLDQSKAQLVAELLPSRPVNLKIFHLAPRDSVLAAGLANPDGEKRLAKILELLDQFVGPIAPKKPSEMLRELEGQLGVNLGQEIVGPITDVAVVMGDPFSAPIRRIEEKGPNFHRIDESPELPLVFLAQATDDKAAQKVLQLVPRIFALVSQERVEPETVTIAGQELRKLKGRGLTGLYYARQGRILVLGIHAQPVAAALTAGNKQQGILTDAKTASRLRELEEPLFVYLVKPASLLIGAVGAGRTSQTTFQAVGEKIIELPKDPPKKIDIKIEIKKAEPKKVGQPPLPVRENIEIVRNPEQEKLLKELGQLLRSEEWLVVGMTRKKDRLFLEGKAPGLDRTVPRLIDFAVEEAFRAMTRFLNSGGPINIGGPVAVGVAGPVGGGQVITALNSNLAQNDPRDRVQKGPHKIHVIPMKAGKTYTIDLQSKDFDAFLRLEDAAGQQLAMDDDGGDGLNSRLVFQPRRNENYRIIATSLGNGTGNYILTVRER